MNVLNTQEVMVIGTCAPHTCQFFQIIDVIEVTLCFHWSFRFDLFKAFSEIVETLLGHDGIVSFIGDLSFSKPDLWRKGINQVWKI